MAVVEHSRAAVASVRPPLRSGGQVESVCARSVEALCAVEAGAHPGDRGMRPAFSDARRRVGPLERRLLPAIAVGSVETFL